MEDLHRSWGHRIKKRRLEMGFTQQSFADIVGVTQATVSRWEQGSKTPSDSQKWRIAGALRQTMEELFPYPGIMPPFPRERVA
jgi:transcriptional regulator with XRE-family HTH domain